jgi:PAS domain S-box-containing protein
MTGAPGAVQLMLLLWTTLSFFLVALFWSLYTRLERRRFFWWWMLAWAAFGLLEATAFIRGLIGLEYETVRTGLRLVGTLAGYLQAPFLFLGALYLQRSEEAPSSPVERWGVSLAPVLGVVFFALATGFEDPLAGEIRNVPRVALVGLAQLYAVRAFLLHWAATRSTAALVAAAATGAQGAVDVLYAVSGTGEVLSALWGVPAVLFPSQLLYGAGVLALEVLAGLGLALGMMLIALEEQQRAAAALRSTDRALRQQEAFLRQVIDLNPSYILARDRDGRFTLGNRSAALAYGTTVEEMIGKTDADFGIDPEQIEYFHRTDREVLESGREMFEPEAYVSDVRGNKWVQVYKQPIRSPDGRADQVLVVASDITARKLAEEELERQRAFLRQVIDLNPTYIFAKDPEGRYTLVNRAFAELYGRRPEEIVGMADAELHQRPDEVAVFQRTDRQVLETGRELHLPEMLTLDPDGRRRWVQVTKRPLKPLDGSTTLVLGVATDITARKEAELAQAVVYRIAQAAEEAARLDDLFRAVHEIVRDVMPAGNFYIALYDQRQDLLSFPYFVDERDPPPAPHRGARGLTEYVLRTGEPLLCNERVAEELTRRGEVELLGSPCQVWVGAPLSAGGKRFGVMALQDYRNPSAYGEREMQVLSFVSNQVARAIERARVEIVLRESEERYRELYEDNPSMYFTVDPGGTVLSVNRFGAEQLGYTAAELVGRSVLEVFHPDDRAAVMLGMQECITTGPRLQQWEFRKVRKDGSVLWVKEAARAVRRSDGSTVVLVVCEDITDQKNAEAMRARLQADVQHAALEWRLTFDAIDAPIILVDSGGRVIRLNEAARAVADKHYDEILGRAIRSVSRGEPWRRAADVAEYVGAARTATSSQVRDEATDRTWDVAASFMPGTGGGEGRVIVVARDITRLVELQESLRRSETMSAMGSLVAGVAHEVRNPLFSMSATLDAFEARYGVRKEYQKHLGVLRGQLERMTRLMQELLDYGKPPSLELAEEAVDEVIEQAVKSCSAHARQARVKIQRRAAKGVPALPMDRLRMVQVFSNLLENAVQHAPSGGTVTVEAALRTVRGQRWVVCSVSDTGPGFAAEDLSKVFEPFFTRRRGGTGLGLSLVQRIVEQHGGRVVAANRPEGGAVIRVNLPVGAPAQVQAPETG